MKKIETNDLLQIIGMLGLIASLIFVGMELRQNQQVARVTAYQALAEQIATYNALLLSEPEINRIRISALNNENLNASEIEMYRAFFRMLKRQSELAYLQYENGIIDEELEGIWAGDKTAQEAMDSAKERGDALLRRFESANR